MSDDIIRKLRMSPGFVGTADGAIAEITRLRSELEQAKTKLAAKDARIAEQTSAAIGLAAVIEMERARAEQAEAQLARIRSIMRPSTQRL